MLKIIYNYKPFLESQEIQEAQETQGIQETEKSFLTSSSFYEIRYLLTNDEYISLEQCQLYFKKFQKLKDDQVMTFSSLQDLEKRKQKDSLCFETLDELKNFTFFLLDELSIRKACLLSVQNYNIGLDGAKDKESFQELFEKYGEILQNEGAKKKSLFSKFI